MPKEAETQRFYRIFAVFPPLSGWSLALLVFVSALFLFRNGVISRRSVESDHGSGESARYIGGENIARNGVGDRLESSAVFRITECVLVAHGFHL